MLLEQKQRDTIAFASAAYRSHELSEYQSNIYLLILGNIEAFLTLQMQDCNSECYQTIKAMYHHLLETLPASHSIVEQNRFLITEENFTCLEKLVEQINYFSRSSPEQFAELAASFEELAFDLKFVQTVAPRTKQYA